MLDLIMNELQVFKKQKKDSSEIDTSHYLFKDKNI